MWNPFQKEIKKKSYYARGVSINGASYTYNTNAKTAYSYYNKIDELADAVKKIAQNVASLPLALEDGDEDIDFIQWLNSPVVGFNRIQFLRELTKSYLLTGEMALILRGEDINTIPVGVEIAYPYDLEIQEDLDGIWPLSIRTTGKLGENTYHRKEEVDENNTPTGEYRYLDGCELNELVWYRSYISTIGSRAESPLNPILLRLEQVFNSNVHNTSLTINGMKLSGVLSPKEGENFDEDAAKILDASIKKTFTGPASAGKLLISATPMEFADLSVNLKDADWSNLMNINSNKIYNYFNIPLAMIDNSASTFDNYRVSQRSLYTQSVFPVAKDIFLWLSEVLGTRFPEFNGRTLEWDTTKIEALNIQEENQTKIKVVE